MGSRTDYHENKSSWEPEMHGTWLTGFNVHQEHNLGAERVDAIRKQHSRRNFSPQNTVHPPMVSNPISTAPGVVDWKYLCLVWVGLLLKMVS